MNKMPHINDDDSAVLAALGDAHETGRPGLYRAEIYDHPACEAIEDIQQISTALSKLRTAGLISKGPRNGPSGSLWTLASNPEPEPAPDLAQKLTDPTDSVEYDEDGNLVAVTCRDDAAPSDPVDHAIDREIDALAARLRTPPHRIEQLQLKQRVLRRLAEITDGSIAAVLTEVAEDIGNASEPLQW